MRKIIEKSVDTVTVMWIMRFKPSIKDSQMLLMILLFGLLIVGAGLIDYAIELIKDKRK